MKMQRELSGRIGALGMDMAVLAEIIATQDQDMPAIEQLAGENPTARKWVTCRDEVREFITYITLREAQHALRKEGCTQEGDAFRDALIKDLVALRQMIGEAGERKMWYVNYTHPAHVRAQHSIPGFRLRKKSLASFFEIKVQICMCICIVCF
jgi:hypothetical protein